MLDQVTAIRWTKRNMVKNKMFYVLVVALLSLFGLGVVKTPLMSTAAAASMTRYVSPTGTDNATCAKASPCRHVQSAVNVANAGDKVKLAAGTYIEQVSISKNLQLVGAGMDSSIISAPAVLANDVNGNKNVVELSGGASLDASKLTVSGPGPSSCGSINAGFAVFGGATLNLSRAAVRDVRDNPFSGCQNGEAIRAGTQPNGSADVGHLVINHVVVTDYNKNGIIVKGAGSSATVSHSSVSTGNHVIAPNGIEAATGAYLSASHNSVSGNECNVGIDSCGPDFVNNVQSTGFLLRGADPSTSVDHNTITGNDIGIYSNSGVDINRNQLDANRYGGITLDGSAGWTGSATVTHNKVANGGYGIWLGNMAGGATTWDGSGTFSHNKVSANAPYDLWWDGSGTPTFQKNKCQTAYPSMAAWDCH